MSSPRTKKEATHDRIVEVAARAIRKRGYDGVGVAEVMQEAGLTHGGFYAHFPSREALLVEALERSGRISAASLAARRQAAEAAGVSPFRALVESYLSDGQLKPAEGGCAVAALLSEMPRQAAGVKKASVTRVQALVAHVARLLSPAVDPALAPVIAGTMVGTLQIARTMGSAAEARALLATARAALVGQYDV